MTTFKLFFNIKFIKFIIGKTKKQGEFIIELSFD